MNIQQIKSQAVTGLMHLEFMGVMEITGHDAARFLQSQTTNDVFSLKSGEGQLSALLDRKAHIQAIFSLHKLGDAYWLLTEKSRIPVIAEHFDKFVIMDEVFTTDHTDEFAVILCQGSQARNFMTALFPEYGFQDSPAEYALVRAPYKNVSGKMVSCMVIHHALTGEDGFLILCPQAAYTEFWQYIRTTGEKTGLPWLILDEETLEILRVEAGILKYGADYDQETLLPETGLERKTVSYTKGCYLGQEIVARVKTYGNLQKWLSGLIFAPEDALNMPAPDTPLVLQGKPIGILKSWVYSPRLNRPIGLAYLHRDINQPGIALDVSVSLEGESGTYSVLVSSLPFQV